MDCFDFTAVIMGYLLAACVAISAILADGIGENSGDVFAAFAGRPTLGKFFAVVAGWPLVLGYVWLKCARKRRTLYRYVSVRERRRSYYVLQRATYFLGWRRWRTELNLNGVPLEFANWAQVVLAAKERLNQEADRQFKPTRRPGPSFGLSIFE